MATATREKTAASEQFPADAFLPWRDERTATRYEFSRRVLEEIRFEATRGMHSIAHGGVEVGGILLGRNLSGVLRILEWRPIQCGHARGPAFSLSAADRGRLASQLDLLALDEQTGSLDVLGLFVSHARGADRLRADEEELAARYFPGTDQILLVVKPDRFGAAEVHVFRRPDGSMKLTAAGASFRVNMRPQPARARTSKSSVSLEAAPAARGGARFGWAVPLALWLGAAALLALSLAGPLRPLTDEAIRRTGLWPPAPIVLLSLVARQDAAGEIELRWRPAADPLHASGTLEWGQGAAAMTRFLSLTEMKAGQAVLASNTDSERVRLTISSPEGVTLREEAVVVRPPVPAPPLPEPEKPAPKAKATVKSAKAVRGRRQTD